METTIINNSVDLSQWFDGLVSSIRVDQALIESGIANKEKREFYEQLINGDHTKVIGSMRDTSSKYFIENIVKDYYNEILRRKANPISLALQLSDSKILVWAVINDDDEECEDKLFLAEASINSRYYSYGFHINTTLVEKSDNCNIPNHFINVLNG